ncbi:MAG: response regulator [Planctomycetes bacterium]|nr:response regulator [Planctomycetota bacterium]
MNPANPEPILLVDDSPELLQALMRQHRKSFNLVIAESGEEAVRLFAEKGPFPVVVSDFQMPGMNGITFLGKVREQWPDTIRIMLTGQADVDVAVNAVNQGRIYRFLSKPCEKELFESVLNEALEQHRLKQAEKVLLEQTVRGSIQVLADILAIVNPAAFGRATRVTGYVAQIVKRMGLENPWMFETAALLCQIGCVAIPGEIIDMVAAGEELPAAQRDIYRGHPAIARRLLVNIPRLEPVAEMVARLFGPWPDRGAGEAKGTGDAVLLGSRILSAALAFDDLIVRGTGKEGALVALRGEAGLYDPQVLAELEHVDLPGQGSTLHVLPVDELRVGMVLDEDLRNTGNMLLVAKGQEVSQSMLERLKNYERMGSLEGPVRVRVSASLCETELVKRPMAGAGSNAVPGAGRR